VNPGEDLFVSYLENRGLSYEREPLIGGRKPDFLAQVRGVEVACEVYEPEIYLPRRQSPDGRSAPLGGFMDPYTRLRRGFEARKRKTRSKPSRLPATPCCSSSPRRPARSHSTR